MRILRNFAPQTQRKEQDMEDFKIREYGRTQLAQMYCPDIMPESAWKKLKKWMERSPGLMQSLEATGYDQHSRSFTPAQVQLIVGALGEP